MNDKIQDNPMQWLLSELAEQAARDVSEPFDERDQLERTLLALFEAAQAGADKQVVLMIRRQMMTLADIDRGYPTPDMFKPETKKGGTPALLEKGWHRKLVAAAVAYVMNRDDCGECVAAKILTGPIKMETNKIRSDYNTAVYKAQPNDLGEYNKIDNDNDLDKLIELINKEIRKTP